MKRLAELVLESATDYAIITMDLRGTVNYWSPGAQIILGWSPEEALGKPVDMIFTPEDRAKDVPAAELGNALSHGRSIDERWHARKDGTVLWASGEMLPLLDDGEPEGFLKILRDRTPQKKAEELQHLLAQELGHRIKNMISVIQSVVNQSFRNSEDIGSAKQAITQRLAVLAGAQDILLAGSTDGTSMAQLVDKALAVAVDSGGARRIGVHGPHVHVGPRAALSVALILHELLTNALKYGALSQAEGKVSIRWSMAILDDEPALELVWTESGGPAVVPPSRAGFGSRLVKGGITSSRCEVDLDYAPLGLQCRILANLADVQKD